MTFLEVRTLPVSWTAPPGKYLSSSRSLCIQPLHFCICACISSGEPGTLPPRNKNMKLLISLPFFSLDFYFQKGDVPARFEGTLFRETGDVRSRFHSTPKTQTSPPSGTSGN